MDKALRDTALRPMNAGLVLDRTFQIYRSHFVVLAGIGVLLPALLLLLRLGFIPLGYPPAGPLHAIPGSSSHCFWNTLAVGPWFI